MVYHVGRNEVDAQRMRDLGKVLKATFATDLAAGASAKALQIRNNNPVYSATNVVDGDTAYCLKGRVTVFGSREGLYVTGPFSVQRMGSRHICRLVFSLFQE